MTRGSIIVRLGLAATLIVIAAIVITAGLLARRWTWDHTVAIRFHGDMHNAWSWGSRGASEGYFGLYERVIAEHPDGSYQLDYVPLRLAVMTRWVAHQRQVDPNARSWLASYEFNRGMLRLNAGMELAAATAVFALVRHWLRKGPQQCFLGAEFVALGAFAMAWLNPASLVSAHGRPTWDCWVMPFYLWAIYAACRNAWFTAGCIIAIGVMFKGQQLVAVPVFLLWPLVGLRIGAAGRWLLGFALAAALVVAPWIIPLRHPPIALVTLLALFWPAVAVVRRRRMPWRRLRWLCVANSAVGLWLAAYLFDGSFAWFRIGFVYGAEKFPSLEIGGASCLASILQNRFGWQSGMPVLAIPWPVLTLTINHVMIGIYLLLTLLCCIGMHLWKRRGDCAFLLAMAGPWIIYFSVFPQMHERYLLWGAIAACAGVACGLGPGLLAAFFAICSTIMSLSQLLNGANAVSFLSEYTPGLGRQIQFFVHRTYPDIAWAILLAMAVWVYLALLPTKTDWKQTFAEPRLGAHKPPVGPVGGRLDRTVNTP